MTSPRRRRVPVASPVAEVLCAKCAGLGATEHHATCRAASLEVRELPLDDLTDALVHVVSRRLNVDAKVVRAALPLADAAASWLARFVQSRARR